LSQQWRFRTHMRQRQTCRHWSRCHHESKVRVIVRVVVKEGVAVHKWFCKNK